MAVSIPDGLTNAHFQKIAGYLEQVLGALKGGRYECEKGDFTTQLFRHSRHRGTYSCLGGNCGSSDHPTFAGLQCGPSPFWPKQQI